MKNLLFVLLAVAAVAVAEAVYHFVRYMGDRKDEQLKQRLRLIGVSGSGNGIFRARRIATTQWLSDALSGVGFIERLERLLNQTDLEMTVVQLCATSLGCAVAGLALGLFLGKPALALVLAVGLSALPVLSVLNARRKRARRISEQLPDALDMMARSLRAGHALPSTLKLVAQECPSPIATEFARTFDQQNLGLAFEHAVMQMAERVPSNLDLRLFAVSVVIQKGTGGNMVEVLENIASTVRERFKFYSKLSALTAEGRVSGIILGTMPFAVAAIILVTNPDYLSELRDGVGRTILLGGIGSWLSGIVWIRSLMKVDY